MPLPANYGTGVVTGTFTDTNGDPVVGTISFTPSASRLLGTGAVILGDPVVVPLDDAGSLTVTLPASDDPNVSPTDFTYRVDETFVGTVGSTYFINVLEGVTLDLADVLVPGTVNNGTVIGAAQLPSQTGNSGKFLTTDGTTASWGGVTATIDGYLHADVAFGPVDTSGTYPASDIDPIADTAAWVSAGGPAFFNVTPGDRVAVNNYNFDPTTTGIYDWDGTTFARAADVATVAQLDKKIIVSHAHHSHFTGAPLTTPIPIAVMFFADDPDGEMGEVSWLGKIFMDFESVGEAAPLLVSAGGGVLTGDSRLSDARTPTAHASSHASAGSDPLTIAQSQVTNLVTDLAAKVPSTRTIAGLDLTTDRTAAALRTALGLWTPIANETLGSASGSRTYDITGYRFVRITMAARSNRNGTIDTIRLRFNGDTSSNYSTNTGSFTTFISAFDISGENTNTDRSGYVVVQFAYMAGAWLTGTAIGTGPASTATTAANSLSTGFAWKGATSAAPTSIEVYTAIGQFVAGSSFLVEGRV